MRGAARADVEQARAMLVEARRVLATALRGRRLGERWVAMRLREGDARREHLLCYIRRRSQTFVTCTNLRAFPDDVMQDALTTFWRCS